MNTSSLMLSTSLLLASSSTLALHAQSGPLGALEADRFGCEADRSHQGAETNDHMGFEMDAGDWNGDGIDDLLVAGAHASLGPCELCDDLPCGECSAPCDANVGDVWLYLGNGTNFADEPALTFINVPSIDEFGPPIAFVGDLDDDGGEDIAIGLPSIELHGPGSATGTVWIFLSGYTSPGGCVPDPGVDVVDFSCMYTAPDIVVPTPTWAWGAGDQPHFGFSVALAGDVNGDGFEDLVVGAPGSPYDPSNRAFECPEAPPPAPLIKGRAFIFAGTDPDDWATEPPFSLWPALEGDEEGDRFGWEVAGVGRLGDEPVVGDPTGPDEHDDVVIGAPESANINKLSFNHLGGGYAHLCFGRDDPYWDDTLPPGMQAPVPVVLVDPQVHTPGSGDPWMFGHSIAGGSDLDQDGSADFLVGDPFYSANGNEQGAVYAYSWDRASASVVPTFIGLVPITLSLDEPDPNGAFQDGSAHLGWDVEMFDQVAFGGQYDALFLDPGAPEFLVGALTNGQDLVPVMACAGELQGGRTNGRAFVLSIVVPDLPDLPFVAVQAVYFGEELRARLGSSVATGDFDGDGRPDVATGSTGYTGSSVETEIGQVHIFKNLATEP